MSKVVIIQMNDTSVSVYHLKTHKNTINILTKFDIDFNNKILSSSGVNESDNVGYRISKELKSHHIATKDAIFTVNSSDILGRKVSVAKQKNDKAFLELLTAKVKSDGIFPISIDDYYITYTSIGSHIDNRVIHYEEETDDASADANTDDFDFAGTDDKTKGAKKSNAKANKPKPVKKQVDRTVKSTSIDCMSYICPKAIVDGIVKIAENAKLNISNIEYGGNSIYQYVSNYVNYSQNSGKRKSDDYIIVHVGDNNTVVSIIADGSIVQQKSISFCYDDICQYFLAQQSIFGLNTTDEIFDFINRCNFLDRESNFLQTEFANLDPGNTADALNIQTITGVQSNIIDMFVSFIEQINSVLVQCRTENIRPELIYYYNERDNFPDIIESIEDSLKLDVMPVVTESSSNLAILSATIKPIDFSLAINTDKAASQKVRSIILAEFVVTFLIGTLYVGYCVLNLKNAALEGVDLSAKIADATLAQSLYNQYVFAKSNYETVLELDSAQNTVLQHFDEILAVIEKSMPKSDFRVGSISAADTKVTLDVHAGSKTAIIKFVQNLEASKRFKCVEYAGITDALNSEEFFTGHAASTVITLEYADSHDETTEESEGENQ